MTLYRTTTRGHRARSRARFWARFWAPLVVLLVCLLTVASAVPAGADDTGSGGKKPPGATVGVRTANAKGGDDRGNYTYEIFPKGVVQDWISVTNFRYTPLTVRLFAKDVTSDIGSTFSVQRSEETPHDVGAWIVLKKTKLTIPPRTEVIVPFQIGVPYNATPGDHTGAIIVSLLARAPKREGGTVIVDHRVGLRVHLRVPGDLKAALSIEKLKTDWGGSARPLGRGDAHVSYLVRNTGNVSMNVQSDLELSRILGLPTVHASAPAIKELLPGGSALVQQTVRNVFGTGPMKTHVTLHGVPVDKNLKDKAVVVTNVAGFSAWPCVLIVILVVVLLLIGFGTHYERRRRRSKKERLAAEEAEQAALLASAKHRLTARSAVVVALVGGLLVGSAGLAAGPATAAPGDRWRATISPTKGIAGEAFDVLASGACPRPATNMVGFGFGPGLPKAGAVVLSNTGPIDNQRPFDAPLVDNMVGIMAAQGVGDGVLRGTYRFEIRCIKPEDPYHDYGSYVAAVKFTDPRHWVALPPLTQKKGPVVQVPTTGPGGEPLSGSAPGASGGPSAGASDPASAGPQAESPKDVQKQIDQIMHPKKDNSRNWALIGGGIAIALASLVLAFGRRIPGPWRRS